MTISLETIQNLLNFRRQIDITLPINAAIAKQNFHKAFQTEIRLTSKFQVPRTYWGKIENTEFQLRGPKANKQLRGLKLNKQLFFITMGQIQTTPEGIHLQGSLYLRPLDFYQIMAAALFLICFVAFTMRLSGLFPLCLVLGILYSMTQWHFSFYHTEITRLLTALAQGEDPSVVAIKEA